MNKSAIKIVVVGLVTATLFEFVVKPYFQKKVMNDARN